MTLSDSTESEIITWMASMLATGTKARFIADLLLAFDDDSAKEGAWRRLEAMARVIESAASNLP